MNPCPEIPIHQMSSSPERKLVTELVLYSRRTLSEPHHKIVGFVRVRRCLGLTHAATEHSYKHAVILCLEHRIDLVVRAHALSPLPFTYP